MLVLAGGPEGVSAPSVVVQVLFGALLILFLLISK